MLALETDEDKQVQSITRFQVVLCSLTIETEGDKELKSPGFCMHVHAICSCSYFLMKRGWGSVRVSPAVFGRRE